MGVLEGRVEVINKPMEFLVMLGTESVACIVIRE